MDLFRQLELTLVDDAEGGIRYRADFVAPDTALRWFDALRDGVAWEHEHRAMYDRMVDVPRLLASYRTQALPSHLPLGEMLEEVRRRIDAPFNAIGLNHYRDGRDSVAMHGDKLHSIVPRQPIALLSLGATRRMVIRAKEGARASIAIELEPGSLLVMSHRSQRSHEHGIPKTSRQVDARISAVFRVRP